MKRVKVKIPFLCFVIVEVEAENKEKAIEEALGEAYVSSFCGNGGADKLIGVRDRNLSIEANDDYLDHKDFKIKVYDENYDEVDEW